MGHERHAQVAQDLAHAWHVPLLHGKDQLDQVHPLGQVQLAHHAGIQEGDLPALQVDQNITRMGIGMEKAVDEQLLDHGTQGVAGDGLALQAGGFDGLDVTDLHALDELHGQDAEVENSGYIVAMCTPSRPAMFSARRMAL